MFASGASRNVGICIIFCNKQRNDRQGGSRCDSSHWPGVIQSLTYTMANVLARSSHPAATQEADRNDRAEHGGLLPHIKRHCAAARAADVV
jgi:hypothetical protein